MALPATNLGFREIADTIYGSDNRTDISITTLATDAANISFCPLSLINQPSAISEFIEWPLNKVFITTSFDQVWYGLRCYDEELSTSSEIIELPDSSFSGLNPRITGYNNILWLTDSVGISQELQPSNIYEHVLDLETLAFISVKTIRCPIGTYGLTYISPNLFIFHNMTDRKVYYLDTTNATDTIPGNLTFLFNVPSGITLGRGNGVYNYYNNTICFGINTNPSNNRELTCNALAVFNLDGTIFKQIMSNNIFTGFFVLNGIIYVCDVNDNAIWEFNHSHYTISDGSLKRGCSTIIHEDIILP